MTIPTITSIQPMRGPSSGQTLLTIAGTGMRLPPPPPASGPTTGALPQTVAIRIGTMPATRVLVRDDAGVTIATCLTPPGTPGPADILLQNLDGAGQPIAGEAVLLLRSARRASCGRDCGASQSFRGLVRRVADLHPGTRAVRGGSYAHGDRLLDAEERMVIELQRQELSELIKGTDGYAIEQQTKRLSQVTDAFAARRLDSTVKAALAGRNLNEIEE